MLINKYPKGTYQRYPYIVIRVYTLINTYMYIGMFLYIYINLLSINLLLIIFIVIIFRMLQLEQFNTLKFPIQTSISFPTHRNPNLSSAVTPTSLHNPKFTSIIDTIFPNSSVIFFNLMIDVLGLTCFKHCERTF